MTTISRSVSALISVKNLKRFACVCSVLCAVTAVAKDDVHEVIVEADDHEKVSDLGLSTVEISGDELTKKLSATLGETLANEPGVHNASYGPGVGLPVLRGLSGVRIRLSEDGVGAWDASSISPDHATAIEPVIAERIQVIKGPATVLYGNDAVGGTVEVTHGRIADKTTGETLSSVFELRKELLNDHERESYVGKVKAEFNKLVVQVDGFVRQSNTMSIPGVAIQEEAIAEVFGISNSDNTFGTVLNTDAKSDSASLALSYVENDFYLGASSTQLTNQYGIPPGAHTEPADSPGHSHSHPVGENIVVQSRVRIDLEQERHLFKLGGKLKGDGLQSYEFTLGHVKYNHLEFELDPQTNIATGGTRFLNDVVEVNAQLNHQLLSFLNANHSGQMGIQWVDREFSAQSQLSGGEDFIPASDQQSVGLYFYEQFPIGAGSVEVGGRYAWQKISQCEPTAPLLPDNVQFMHAPITYQTYTFSTALNYALTPAHNLTLNLNTAQRAPEIQELLSLGSHLATRSYDIGLLLFERQPGEDLPKPEKFYGTELRWEWQSALGEMYSAVFYTEANDFIYQQKRPINGLFDISDNLFRNACVRLEECIAVFDYTQDDVTLTGYEWQWLWPGFDVLWGELQVELFADYVRGKLVDGRDLPRMPPRRQGVGFKWGKNNFNADMRYSFVSKQNNPGESETATEAYELLNINLSYDLHVGGSPHQDVFIFLNAKNILDEEIRKSTSFLRNFTPEPGREIALGFRYAF